MVIRVQTRDNEPVEKALRRLRKLCNNEGVTRAMKSKAFFEKPSEKRRREARDRLKAIRISAKARKQEIRKLLQRRKKARKQARAAARAASETGARAGAAAGADTPVAIEGAATEVASGAAAAPAVEETTTGA